MPRQDLRILQVCIEAEPCSSGRSSTVGKGARDAPANTFITTSFRHPLSRAAACLTAACHKRYDKRDPATGVTVPLKKKKIFATKQDDLSSRFGFQEKRSHEGKKARPNWTPAGMAGLRHRLWDSGAHSRYEGDDLDRATLKPSRAPPPPDNLLSRKSASTPLGHLSKELWQDDAVPRTSGKRNSPVQTSEALTQGSRTSVSQDNSTPEKAPAPAKVAIADHRSEKVRPSILSPGRFSVVTPQKSPSGFGARATLQTLNEVQWSEGGFVETQTDHSRMTQSLQTLQQNMGASLKSTGDLIAEDNIWSPKERKSQKMINFEEQADFLQEENFVENAMRLSKKTVSIDAHAQIEEEISEQEQLLSYLAEICEKNIFDVEAAAEVFDAHASNQRLVGMFAIRAATRELFTGLLPPTEHFSEAVDQLVGETPNKPIDFEEFYLWFNEWFN
eukprot:gnl/MRDRNA2_/MRDRNA2_175777_c0_seq1.p1 gnl/MRDRNA2_/MRDRNA2_175777_c0~~gnl/MRDRNA2_/MRDRNA2_175777_c0_seq1.p1  ORF type:complete len:458 (-),score=98.92 gnl/MRDRNA2_/MRDRNA2_175777_c0_seq1:54-1391(-)